jgi:hypothetical protein
MFYYSFFALGFVITHQNLPSAGEVLNQALEQRRAIVTASLTADCSSEDIAKKTNNREVVKLFMDHDKFRKDVLILPKNVGSPTISCMNCEKDRHYLVYFGETAGTLVRKLEFGKLGDKHNGLLFVADPRVIGLSSPTVAAMQSSKIDSILGSVGQANPTIKLDKVAEHNCYVIQATVPGQVVRSISIWIVPEFGYNVTRIESIYQLDGSKLKSTIETELSQYCQPPIWFPKSVSEIINKDDKVISHNTMVLTDVQLNCELPTDTFNIKGMSIPPGMRVTGSVYGSRTHIWDGSEIVDEPTSSDINIKERPDNQSSFSRERRQIFLVVLSITLMISAIVVFLIRRRKSTA